MDQSNLTPQNSRPSITLPPTCQKTGHLADKCLLQRVEEDTRGSIIFYLILTSKENVNRQSGSNRTFGESTLHSKKQILINTHFCRQHFSGLPSLASSPVLLASIFTASYDIFLSFCITHTHTHSPASSSYFPVRKFVLRSKMLLIFQSTYKQPRFYLLQNSPNQRLKKIPQFEYVVLCSTV